jgi:putative DNA primase/helicase
VKLPGGSDSDGDAVFDDSTDAGRNDALDALAHRPVRGYNDTAYAEAFGRRLEHKLRFDHHQGRFLYLDDHHWAIDDDGTVPRMMRWFVKQRYAAALRTGDDDTIAAARSFLNHGRQRTVLDAAKSVKPLADRGGDWDSTPYLLGVGNGVVDLRDRSLRDGLAEDRITLWTDEPYIRTAECPRFLRFLDEVFATSEGAVDEELVAYVKRALGYSITGETSEQKLFLCKGTPHGANGKGTLFRAVEAVIQRFVVSLPFAVVAGIGNQRFREPAYELANLPGRRIALCSEAAEGAWFKTERIKALTGQDTIPVRAIYGHPFWTRPVAKYWLAVNKAPMAPKDDDAFFRRLQVLPFDNEFELDPGLDEELKSEAEGILRLLVDEAAKWYETRSLGPVPKRVERAIQSYRRSLDGLEEYFEERVVMDPNGSVDRGVFKKDYVDWCEDHGVDQIKGWTSALLGRGLIVSTRAEGEKRPQVWRGARLKDG